MWAMVRLMAQCQAAVYNFLESKAGTVQKMVSPPSKKGSIISVHLGQSGLTFKGRTEASLGTSSYGYRSLKDS